MELHSGTQHLGELDRAPHVFDRRDVPQHGPALVRQQRSRDHLKRRVLSTLDEDRALQRRAATDAIADLGALGHVDTAPVRGGETTRTARHVGEHALANALSSMPPDPRPHVRPARRAKTCPSRATYLSASNARSRASSSMTMPLFLPSVSSDSRNGVWLSHVPIAAACTRA